MPQIIAWKCDETGQVFEHETKYEEHKRNLKAQHAEVRRRERAFSDAERVIAPLYLCRTHEEIATWLVENSDAFLAAQKTRGHLREHRRHHTALRITGIEFRNAGWEQKLSNSHDAPIGRATNWGGRHNDVRGYPGWRSTIVLHLNRDFDGFVSDIFRGTAINTGTGGGGHNGGTYECRLFADDFPAMRAWENRANPRLKQRRDGTIMFDDKRTVYLNPVLYVSAARIGQVLVRRRDVFVPCEPRYDKPLIERVDTWLRENVGWDDNHQSSHDMFVHGPAPATPAVMIEDMPGPRRRYSHDAERQHIFFHDIRDARKFRAAFGAVISNADLMHFRGNDDALAAMLLDHETRFHSCTYAGADEGLSYVAIGRHQMFRDEEERLMYQLAHPEAHFSYADKDVARHEEEA